MTIYPKRPEAMLDYLIDWGAGLAGRSVARSEWSATPEGIAILENEADGARTRVRMSGGEAGETYRITNRVLLSDGQAGVRSLAVRLEAR